MKQVENYLRKFIFISGFSGRNKNLRAMISFRYFRQQNLKLESETLTKDFL
jgi:hypothetical protein